MWRGLLTVMLSVYEQYVEQTEHGFSNRNEFSKSFNDSCLLLPFFFA